MCIHVTIHLEMQLIRSLFFSSRRRHTRYWRDWSSDVCFPIYADNRLYGNLGHLRPVKDGRPGMQIAVGGCLAQKDRGEIVRRAPWVDVVFGTHNVGSLPALLERARHNAEAQVEIAEALEVFPSTLPAKRDSAY